MKRVFLLMVVSGLLVMLGLAQTPDAGSNTDHANVKGCLGGSDGNYTVAEDGTRQILKITSSSVDLKPHLGHDVNLIGHKASGAASSGAADNSFAVTELNMISDHCAVAAVAPVATTSPSSETVIPPAAAATAPAATTSSPPSETASTPVADATTPAATSSPSSETVSPPAPDATTPAATANPSSETVSTPAANATTPVATVSPSSTVSAPAADAAQPTGQSARPRRASATKTAAAAAPAASDSPSSDPVIPTAADTTTPAATANASSETVSSPAPAATTPAVTHRSGSLFLLILVAVLVVVLGTLVPVFGRWRKRKMLERTGTPNLSFTKEESSDRNKPAPRKAA
jgi:hypothetical protein